MILNLKPCLPTNFYLPFLTIIHTTWLRSAVGNVSGYICESFVGGTSFVDLLCFCPVLCLLCLCTRLFTCALWSPAGKGLTSWL